MIALGVCGLVLLTRISPALAVWGMTQPEYMAGNEHYGAIVHLMEWPYEAIMQECNYLDWRGYFGIIISPPIEHVVDKDGPSWEERYKPISTTNMITRSGTKEQLEKMIDDCWGRQRMRFIVDLNLNNMLHSSDADATGFGFSRARPTKYEYPDGITRAHFHTSCKLPADLKNEKDRKKIRECEVNGMQDLDQKNEDLKNKQVAMMNELIRMGVAGFRIALARHMHPDDLYKMYLDLKEMRNGQKVVTIHDVNDLDTCIVKAQEYERAGMTTDYEYGLLVGKYFLKESRDLQKLLTWGGVDVNGYLRLRDKERLVFLYNHLTPQSLREKLLKKENEKAFGMATAFLMAFPYGIPMVMSSYNGKVAPLESERMVKSPRPVKVPADQFRYTCDHGYNCEHRNELTNKMALFKADVKERKLSLLKYDKSDHWFAIEREERGFVFFNAGTKDITKTITGLRMDPGEYCDVATGELIEVRTKCSGKIITINDDGSTTITIEANDPIGYVAIHREVRLHKWNKVIGEAVGTNEHLKYMVGFAGKAMGFFMKKGLDAVDRLTETYKDPNAGVRDFVVAGVGEGGANVLDAAGTVAIATAKGVGNMAKQKLKEAAARRDPNGASSGEEGESTDEDQTPAGGRTQPEKTPKSRTQTSPGKKSSGDQKPPGPGPQAAVALKAGRPGPTPKGS